ncbi:MAG: hypothetical protein HY714_04270 [Candidatus Omnitrophica bacterium]|nr:hypothetical protein [Candidatus Omnitrophota bacterium]
MKKYRAIGSLLAAIFLAAGCVHSPLVKNDEVLIFNRAFDYTYDGVLRAIDTAAPWGLSHTDKQNGVIVAFNQDYWDTLDADKRTAVIQIKTIARKETSVQLAPESQHVIGGADLLKAIKVQLGEVKK